MAANLAMLCLLLFLAALAIPCNPAWAEPAWNLQHRRAGDPELEQAKEEAQKRWSLFSSEFKKNQSRSDFHVKIPLRDGEKVEHIWLRVTGVNGDKVNGTIDSDLEYVHNYRTGQQLAINRSDVEDWSYTQGDAMIGGWSVAVFLKQHPELKDRSPKYIQPK